MPVTVTPVSGRRDIDAFIKLPFRLYRDDPNWVPPLLYLERQRFEPKTNPFLQHADAQLYCLRRQRQRAVRWRRHLLRRDHRDR